MKKLVLLAAAVVFTSGCGSSDTKTGETAAAALQEAGKVLENAGASAASTVSAAQVWKDGNIMWNIMPGTSWESIKSGMIGGEQWEAGSVSGSQKFSITKTFGETEVTGRIEDDGKGNVMMVSMNADIMGYASAAAFQKELINWANTNFGQPTFPDDGTGKIQWEKDKSDIVISGMPQDEPQDNPDYTHNIRVDISPKF